MRSASDFLSRCSLLRRPLCFTLLAAALTIPGLVADARQQPLSDVVSQRGSRTASGSRRAEIRFTDDSNLRLTLEVERIELATPYGKLQIPMAAVRRVEFATRVPTELTERLMGIVTDLESNQFRVREGASAELKKLGERAYSVLLQATKHKDQEVVQRAESLLKELRDAIPEELLEIRKHDVVHTRDSIIAGRIEAVSFKATTSQFGEVQLKLADMYSLQLLVGGGNPGSQERSLSYSLFGPQCFFGRMGDQGPDPVFREAGGDTLYACKQIAHHLRKWGRGPTYRRKVRLACTRFPAATYSLRTSSRPKHKSLRAGSWYNGLRPLHDRFAMVMLIGAR
jgi:hypothetical protein